MGDASLCWGGAITHHLVTALRTSFRRVRETAATLTDIVRDRCIGVCDYLKYGVGGKLDW